MARSALDECDTRNLDVLFNPKSIALVGASRNRRKIGHAILSRLIHSRARFFAVNPHATQIDGVQCYPSLAELPETPEMVLIARPAAYVPEIVRECVGMGVGVIIPVTGGFGEIGAAGRQLEATIRTLLEGTETRMLGPNSIGILRPWLAIDTRFDDISKVSSPQPGGIAIVSQSGSVGSLIVDQASYNNTGFSAFVSLGNKLDINENDIFAYLATDPSTKAITFYLENFTAPRVFLRLAREISPTKPVVVLKAGRTDLGSRAVALHTGNLAGSDRVVDGAFRQYGIIRAGDSEELIDFAKAMVYQRPMRGSRVAIVTIAGGMGVIATDLIMGGQNRVEGGTQLKHKSDGTGHQSQGLGGVTLAALSDETKAKLRTILVPYASVENPIDFTGVGSDETYDAAIEILQDAPEVDGILALAFFQPPQITQSLVDILAKWSMIGAKPLVVASFGGEFTAQRCRALELRGVAVYPTIRRAVTVLRALAQRGALVLETLGK